MSTPWRHGTRQRRFRDFHRQRYGNPLFPRAGGRLLRGRSSARRGGGGIAVPKGLIALLALGAAMIGGMWYLIWSPALRIASFEVQGASVPTEETVRAALDGYAGGTTLLLFPRRNILFFSEGAVRKEIEKAVFLAGVDIRKKLPGTVVVTIREKTVKAVMERDGRLYALDESGFVIRELSGKELSLMGDLPPGFVAVPVQGLGAESVDLSAPPAPPAPAKADPKAKKVDPPPAAEPEKPKNAWPLILDKRSEDGHKDVRKPGAQAFSSATIALILQANARLPDVAGETVRWFIPDETSDSVDAIMAAGWHVYMATAAPFDVQAERLSLILKEKIGARRPALEYIDLRYNERIFFRLKDGAL